MKNFNPTIKILNFKEFSEGIANLNIKIQCKESDQIKNYVLRICNPMFEDWKFKKEYNLLNYLSDYTKIPVPKVLYTDGTKMLINFKYYITEFIQGKSLEEIELELDSKSLKTIFSELGDYLTELHKIQLHRFGGVEFDDGKLQAGPLRDGGYCNGPFDSWNETILSLYNYYLEKISQIKPFSDLVSKCEKYINANIQSALCNTPILIHKNLYEKSNILIHKNHISGILDFEWAEAADNEYEIIQIGIMINELLSDQSKSDILNSFFSNYKHTLSPHFQKKKDFYSFLEKIHLMNVWEYIKDKFTIQIQKKIIKNTRQFIISKT